MSLLPNNAPHHSPVFVFLRLGTGLVFEVVGIGVGRDQSLKLWNRLVKEPMFEVVGIGVRRSHSLKLR